MNTRQVYSYRPEITTFPAEPERIVSFSPSVTEILFEIGLGSKLVGISAFCRRPAETSKIRRIGSYGHVRLDLLEELKPDVIFTVSGYQDQFTRELAKNFQVICFELPSTVPAILDLIIKVGVACGRGDIARQLAINLMSGVPRPVKHEVATCYIEIDLASPITFGAFSYITDALRYFGLRNIFGTIDKEWISSDLNAVKEIDPDVIIYEPKMFSTFTDNDLQRMIKERGWTELKAIKSNNVYKTPGNLDFFAHHGPSFIREVMPWTQDISRRLDKTVRV